MDLSIPGKVRASSDAWLTPISEDVLAQAYFDFVTEVVVEDKYTYVKVAGIFVQASPRVKVNGAWVRATMYIKESGSWIKFVDKQSTPSIPLIASLVDNFATQDATKWVFGSNTSVSSGQAVIATTWNENLSSANAYDFRGSSLSVEVPNGAGRLSFKNAANDYILVFTSGTNIYIQDYMAGSWAGSNSTTYDSTNHRWWRVSLNAAQTTATLEVSANGTSWSTLLTLAVSISGSYEATTVGLFSGAVAPAYYDNINT